MQQSDVGDSSESGNDTKSDQESSDQAKSDQESSEQAKSDQAKSNKANSTVAKPTEPDFFGDQYATDDFPSQTVSGFWPRIVFYCVCVSIVSECNFQKPA